MKKGTPLTKLFPHSGARDAADAAVDRLPVDRPMSEFLDAWETAYWIVAGDSPMRPKATR